MKFKFAIAGALLALGLASPAFADSYDHRGDGARYDDRGRDDYVPQRHAQWQLIGSGEVSFRPENDRYRVPGFQRFRQIMVCAYRAPVRLLDLDVRYQNGSVQDLNVRDVLQPNSCTRAIDLRGFRRDLELVSIDYKTVGFGRVGFDDRWGDRRHGRHNEALVRIYAR